MTLSLAQSKLIAMTLQQWTYNMTKKAFSTLCSLSDAISVDGDLSSDTRPSSVNKSIKNAFKSKALRIEFYKMTSKIYAAVKDGELELYTSPRMCLKKSKHRY